MEEFLQQIINEIDDIICKLHKKEEWGDISELAKIKEKLIAKMIWVRDNE